jgi:hypothetical protein
VRHCNLRRSTVQHGHDDAHDGCHASELTNIEVPRELGGRSAPILLISFHKTTGPQNQEL